ncbi:twin-arginine translocase subunit TatC [Aureibaculum marinum]|uniref:Sec-independent protein translocase protein TatC n=1 Tax=Aureibaculum marinum TaxID=2487930 RepID=A0A3N4NU92_9FLAO|nr:twin-arginine translocase subunit TatC [Aureibaculum marinum]RPD90733.1 twin-arginine translocase subunit TatC [Aureibaculum marinum]
MAKKKSKEEKEMSFLDHLEVLRWTLVRSTLAILIMSSVAFLMKSFIFEKIILLPKDPQFYTYKFLCNLSQKFGTEGLCIDEIPFLVQSRTMAGQFSAHIWTSITVGFIAAFPFILWEIWKFIKPALYASERKYARSFIIISSLLFFFGVLFGYFLLTPLSVNFLGSYRVADEVNNNIDLNSYIGLLRASVLASGLIFEMPIIIFFLAKMGLVTPEFLKKYRKYAIVVLLLLAAIITPPDVISQFIVAIPMAILYELSIIIATVIARKEKKRAAKA